MKDVGCSTIPAQSYSYDCPPTGHHAQVNLVMARYARGDDKAFDDVYRLLRPRLYQLCLRLAGATDAEELLQDVFLKMHRIRANFVSPGSAVGWSFAIARTTQLDCVRRRRRRPSTATDPSQLDQVAGHGSAPDCCATRHLRARLLDRELTRLPTGLRVPYTLVKLEGLSCADAGTALGISREAVKQRVHRATLALKRGVAAKPMRPIRGHHLA
jgi:RNA polymerase sigma-70 factor (ECF subfamily)